MDETRTIEFDETIHYDTRREKGTSDSFPIADCENLVQGGYAHYVEDPSQGEATNPDSNSTPNDEGRAPEDNDADGDTTTTPPVGPDAPAGQPTVEESFVCPEGCRDGKPFATGAALAAHRKQKHEG